MFALGYRDFIPNLPNSEESFQLLPTVTFETCTCKVVIYHGHCHLCYQYIRFTKDDQHEESWTKKWRSTGIFTFMFWEVLRNSSTAIVFLHQLYLWVVVCQCHNQLYDSHRGLCCCTSVQYGMHGVMVVQEELFTNFHTLLRRCHSSSRLSDCAPYSYVMCNFPFPSTRRYNDSLWIHVRGPGKISITSLSTLLNEPD